MEIVSFRVHVKRKIDSYKADLQCTGLLQLWVPLESVEILLSAADSLSDDILSLVVSCDNLIFVFPFSSQNCADLETKQFYLLLQLWVELNTLVSKAPVFSPLIDQVVCRDVSLIEFKVATGRKLITYQTFTMCLFILTKYSLGCRRTVQYLLYLLYYFI